MVKPKQLGHLVLRVRDPEASEKWYAEMLGLHTTTKSDSGMIFMSAKEDSSHELALVGVGPDAPGPEDTRVGLFHFAWEMESFEDLENLYTHLKAKGANLRSLGDHGISMGVYLFDPDGNEIEVYYESPKQDWQVQDGDYLFGGEFPRQLEPVEVAD